MPIIVLGGIKGGSGKSTLASNLTVIRSEKKAKVLLVDADEQRSISDWVEHRESLKIPTIWTTINLIGTSLRNQILKMKSDYDDIIIDTGGRDTTSQRAALTVADIFLVPFQPRSLDVWTLGKVSELINEIKLVNPNLKSFSVINRGDPYGNDNKQACEILKESEEFTHLSSTIGQRKAFSNATAQGFAVTELINKDKKANSEIETLYKMLFK